MDGLLRAKASHIQRLVDGEGGLCKHFYLFLAQTLVGTFSDSRPRLMAHCQMRDREEESWCPHSGNDATYIASVMSYQECM